MPSLPLSHTLENWDVKWSTLTFSVYKLLIAIALSNCSFVDNPDRLLGDCHLCYFWDTKAKSILESSVSCWPCLMLPNEVSWEPLLCPNGICWVEFIIALSVFNFCWMGDSFLLRFLALTSRSDYGPFISKSVFISGWELLFKVILFI